jgi:lipopolysaccharide/colanic/teichoic acid biosynthesis glycosyltransferase
VTGSAGSATVKQRKVDDPIPISGVKRGTDALIASLLLFAAAPVAAAAVIAMGADMLLCRRDRGRFVYRERRISRGREFDLLKLRTVREDRLAAMDEPGGHARLLEADHGNLTWAGRHVLKPWYLDELPQLVNVLRGDMSLVGPRPWPRSLVAGQVGSGVDYRLRVPAGWTGPAQIAKGTDASFEELDLSYVGRYENSSPWELLRYDLGILRRTVATVLHREGLNY